MSWFGRFSKTAAWLLVPYLLWASYATLLNISIVVLNM
ncbi:tryptophan-rich sensory protein [Mucilaginibacter sp.]|nr:tryptophan-rich sensory protein [Mucilaginibacter sp.]